MDFTISSFRTEVFISPFDPTIVTLDIGSGEDDNKPIDVGGQCEGTLKDGVGNPCLSFNAISKEEL